MKDDDLRNKIIVLSWQISVTINSNTAIVFSRNFGDDILNYNPNVFQNKILVFPIVFNIDKSNDCIAYVKANDALVYLLLVRNFQSSQQTPLIRLLMAFYKS